LVHPARAVPTSGTAVKFPEHFAELPRSASRKVAMAAAQEVVGGDAVMTTPEDGVLEM
jgi:hypothetical protein